MDSSRLVGAYQPLLRAARSVAEDGSASVVHDSVCWLLCHLALFDENLTSAAQQITMGSPAIVESAAAMCADLIGSLVAAHLPLELVELAESNATALAAALESLPDDRADTLVRVKLSGRTGRLVFDEWLGWRDLIEMRTREHLPHHVSYMASLITSLGTNPADA